MRKRIFLILCCALLTGCDKIKQSITETITPLDTLTVKKTEKMTPVPPPNVTLNVDSLIKTVVKTHTTTYTNIHIEGKTTDFLKNTNELEKAENALRNLSQYAGKEIFVYSTLYFYNDGAVNIMLQHPENPKYIDAYEYRNGKWSDPTPIQLSVRDDLKGRLVSLNKTRFVNAARVFETYNKKALETEGAKPATSTYLTTWNNEIRWYPTTINGSRERYSVQFNEDGSLKSFKQD